MKQQILELIEVLDKQKQTYASLAREDQFSDGFFSGKLAGLYDEISDLKLLIRESEIELKEFEVTYHYDSYRSAKFKAATKEEAEKLADKEFQENGWDNFKYDCADATLESIEEIEE